MLSRDPTLRRARHALDPERDTPVGLGLRALQRYADDGMPERAPTLAYYGILSLFPSILLAFAVVRLVAGDSAPADIAAYAREHGASGALAGAVRSAGGTAESVSSSTAGAVGLASVLTLVYGASRAFTATGRAIDAIGRQARRPRSLLRRAEDIAWTLVLLALCLVVGVLAMVSGKVLEEILGLFGISGAATAVWAIIRWPIAAALTALTVAVVRWAAPTGGRPPFRLLSPGRITTVAALAVATAGFNVYVTSIADYNATYGAFAGAIVLMLWISIAGSSLLFGAELDAVIDERGLRSARAAEPAALA